MRDTPLMASGASSVDRSAPAAVPLEDALFLAAALAWGAAAIHVEAAISDLGDHVLFAAFFACLAIGQLLLGIAIYRRPARGLLLAGGAVSLAVVGLWIASRTSGLPIGPGRWTPGAVGPADSLATADELCLALIVACRIGTGRPGRLTRGMTSVVTAAGVFLILLNAMVLTIVSTGHVNYTGPGSFLCHLG
jgi:hypothetical protein